jgi:type VI secretion system protein VasG
VATADAGQSQLERLRPLLDAQSDERPEVQQEAELAQSHGGEWRLSGVRLVLK